jgi:two-component system NtrC family sensor kinase
MNDLIEFSDDFKNKEKFGQLTDSVIQSVDRCRKITHRLLGFARRLDIQMEPMNVNSVIREVTSFLEREAVYRKIDLRLKLDETLHMISSDKGQIQQVFLNLLTNAFAAVEDKGIITVVSSNLDEGEGIRVDVSDNGCGIPETIIKNIFDPFFSTKKEKGTGLGLSITYGIVKKLNGSITVKSREGEGTTFSVILPVEPPTSSEEKNDPDTH